MATVSMPSSRQPRITLIAISPRFAMSTFSKYLIGPQKERASFDHHQDIPVLDDIPGVHEDLLDLAVSRGIDRVLHFIASRNRRTSRCYNSTAGVSLVEVSYNM